VISVIREHVRNVVDSMPTNQWWAACSFNTANKLVKKSDWTKV